ncbi:hypothetical protein EDWATA_01682 [Edwardsiella tarda ATCC 23685]|uniref:Uncharacterized protein n=1 Tax=Edwardsiella tarda ATCC 23685 TaxID=500638 RepID=D4F4K9_EDWTA|nr:hypothetical protein EDWATA_01682 [Edwardsiella tarda ATCC 23685]GAC63260.1 hypothetical protein ET1_04_00070 [Edwardsiella tarda ATCC 15947 = NBRC 105688]
MPRVGRRWRIERPLPDERGGWQAECAAPLQASGEASMETTEASERRREAFGWADEDEAAIQRSARERP